MPTKIPVPPPLPPAPPIVLIGQAHVDAGQLPCATCGEGVHVQQTNVNGWQRIDQDGRWANCTACGARPLNNAQRADVLTIVANNGQALVGACLGSRKTGTSVAAMNYYRGVWIIVAPLHTVEQWERAVNEWAPQAVVHIMDKKNRTALIDLKEDRGPFSVHIIGWELLRRRDLKNYRYIDGTILDEVHRMAGMGTVTAKSVWKINSTRRISLSGTPANTKLHGLFNVLHWTWWGNKDHKQHDIFRRYRLYRGDEDQPGWLMRHFRLTPSQFGGDYSIDIGPELVFHSVLDEIPCYIQHLEEETCCEWHPGGVNATLPPAEAPRVIYTDMTAAQRRLYERASSKEALLWLVDEEGNDTATMVDNAMARKIRQKQIALAIPSIEKITKTDSMGVTTTTDHVFMKPDAASGKIDALLSLLEDIVEDDEPVLIFTHSKVFAKIVVARIRAAKEIPYPVAEWSGDVKAADRDKIKLWFGKQGGPQIIVAVIASIAEGTDGLQERCRREVWLSWDVWDMLNKQAIGRLRRTGQKRRNQRWDIITRDTIEEDDIKKLLADRADLEARLRATPTEGLAQLSYTM